jgi:hypothetical protein
MVKDFTLKNSLFFQDENFPQLVFGVRKNDMYDFTSSCRDHSPFQISVYFNPGEVDCVTEVISLEVGDVLNLKKKLYPDSTQTILVQIDSIFFKNKGRSALLHVSHL